MMKFNKLILKLYLINIEEVNGYWNTGKLAYPFGRGINFEMKVLF